MGDPAGPVGRYSRRSGSDTGCSGGSGGGSGGNVGFGAGGGRRENGVRVDAGDAGSERVETKGARWAGGGEGDQGGGSSIGGCRGQGCGIRDSDEADEIIPSGWVEAPAELSLPGDSAEHGPKVSNH